MEGWMRCRHKRSAVTEGSKYSWGATDAVNTVVEAIKKATLPGGSAARCGIGRPPVTGGSGGLYGETGRRGEVVPIVGPQPSRTGSGVDRLVVGDPGRLHDRLRERRVRVHRLHDFVARGFELAGGYDLGD